jgi:hypothetical protein
LLILVASIFALDRVSSGLMTTKFSFPGDTAAPKLDILGDSTGLCNSTYKHNAIMPMKIFVNPIKIKRLENEK